MIRTFIIGAVAALVCSAASGAAEAGPIRTFDLQGRFDYADPNGPVPGPDLDGTLSIDIGEGSVVGAQVMFFDPAYSSYTVGYDPASNAVLFDLSSNPAELFLIIDAPSLIGYAGGPLASRAAPSQSGSYSTMALPLVPTPELAWGSLVPQQTSRLLASSPVPEPLSGVLFATGLAGLLLTGRVRPARTRRARQHR